MKELVAWFKKFNEDSLNLVGRKSVALNRLYSKDFPVPAGFVVTTESYTLFMQQIESQVRKLIDNTNIKSEAAVQETANQIQKLILNSFLPQKVENEIEEAYSSMDVIVSFGKKLTADYFLNTKEKAKVCVRSSPFSENSNALSVSKLSTYVNVQGVEQLKRAVKACWASVFTGKALYHRLNSGFGLYDVKNAVIVQKLVQSEKSAMVYSVNPASCEDEIVIEAVKGFAKGLEEFIPSTYVVAKQNDDIKSKDEKTQRFAYFCVEKGRLTVNELPDIVISKPALENNEIWKIANIAKEIEATFGRPVKIEFAVEPGNNVFVMDSCPLDVNVKPKEEEMYEEDETEEAVEDQEETTELSEEEYDGTDSEETEETEEESDEETEAEPEEEVEEQTDDSETEEEVEEEPQEEETTEEETEEEPQEEETSEETEDVSEDAEETEETEEAEDEASEEPEEEAEEQADESETEEAEEEPQEEEASEEETEEVEEEASEESEEVSEEASESSDDEDLERDYESRLNELFDEYSQRINSILEEFKEEALNIVKR
ncbi:PEP/pyruvate-binding domain-containing protein [Candidatus Woesearchaeota archaeon]|nr:PEP/pyruvate-binding domain-containing protein [Candidatus Woesearchaeota archaeon]